MASRTIYAAMILLMTFSSQPVRVGSINGTDTITSVAERQALRRAYMEVAMDLDVLLVALQRMHDVIYVVVSVTLPGKQVHAATIRGQDNKTGHVLAEWEMMRWLTEPMSPRRMAAEARRRLALDERIGRPAEMLIKTKNITIMIGHIAPRPCDCRAGDERSILGPVGARLRAAAKKLMEEEKNTAPIVKTYEFYAVEYETVDTN